ncbi:MAG TPA: hypothetical protein VEH81_15560 [Ktedonobacteraceae bacterium]|nr:hypothetical protein [Ktedonobacteraceae bacterium]
MGIPWGYPFYTIGVCVTRRPKTTEAEYLPNILPVPGSRSLLQAVKV